jgi:predicted RNase H-like HicB family nuclease
MPRTTSSERKRNGLHKPSALKSKRSQPAQPGVPTRTLRRFTAVIQSEGDGYVSLCPELDIASQGDTIDEARDNLKEALELFFECASIEEIDRRMGGTIYLTQVEVAVG